MGALITVDCFANSINAKVSRFYSLFFQPGSLGVDSLAFDWGQENCWLVPPVCLIPRALMHNKCMGLYGNLARDFVVDFLFVKNGAEVFVQGANKETCFGSSAFNSPVLFLKLDGTRSSLVHWD